MRIIQTAGKKRSRQRARQFEGGAAGHQAIETGGQNHASPCFDYFPVRPERRGKTAQNHGLEDVYIGGPGAQQSSNRGYRMRRPIDRDRNGRVRPQRRQ